MSHLVSAAASRNALLRRRSGKRRGVAMVEYAFLLTMVAIPALMGLTAGGISMFHHYVQLRNHLLLPTP